MSKHETLTEPFEDARGRIQDLITGPVDSVVLITNVAGAVRGNHVHEKTVQWTYVLDGKLLMASGKDIFHLSTGEICKHNAGDPHAWRALVDTTVLVFTWGPRGVDFESDTTRLETPILVPSSWLPSLHFRLPADWRY